MVEKVKSVLETAFYRVGDTTWRVFLRPNYKTPEVSTGDLWMSTVHSKVYFDRKFLKTTWPGHGRIPKLEQNDFNALTNILMSDIIVEQFVIDGIYRNNYTGEFIYHNEHGNEMPQSFLFDTKLAANRERSRILNIIRKWLKYNA